MDPDDMLLNKKIFEDLYNFNFKYNLDIIEYSVICYIEKILSLTIIEYYYHYHNFSKIIIYQNKLSDIFFHKKNLKQNTWIYCRVIWNKIIRRKVLLNSILYIGID